MGTTAEKLTYLNTTKGKIKDSINLTGAGITNQDTFRSYASLLKTGLVSIINNGIDQLYSNFPKVSGIGSNLSLTPTYEAPMRNLPLGNTYQSISLVPSEYEQVDYLKSDGNSYIDTNVKPTSSTRFYIKASTDGVTGHTALFGSRTQSSTLPFLSFLETRYSGLDNSIRVEIGSIYGNTEKQWTTNEPIEIEIDVPNKKVLVNNEQISKYNNLSYNTSNNVTMSLFAIHSGTSYIYPIVGKIFRCKIYDNGSIIRDFIPCYRISDNVPGMYDIVNNVFYTNLGSGTFTYGSEINVPIPELPVPIQSVTGLQNINITGKNLFDKNNITSGKRLYYWQGTANLIDDANYCVSDYINVFENSIYTINLTMSAYTRMIFFDNNKSPLSANETNATFTTPDNTAYVRISVPLNQLDTTQLELGSTATTYEPYKGNTYEVNLGKNLFDIDYMLESQYTASGTSTTGYNKTNDNITSAGNYTSSGRRFLNHIILPKGTYTLSFNQTFSGTNKDLIYSVRNFTTLTDLVSATTLASLEDNTRVSFSFTLNEKTDIFISIQPANSNGGTLTLSNVQLEKGSETSYNPYFTSIELNKINTYQDSIKKSDGKNLFDKTTMTDGKWLLANGDEEVATQYCISDFIPVIENEQYYLPKTDTRRLKYYDSNKQPLTTSDWDISSGTEGQIINVPSNVKYVRFTIHKTVVDINTFMFNKGSTALLYEPYGKVWYIEKQIDKAVYTSSDIANAPRTYSNVKFFTIAKPTNSYMYNNYKRGNLLYTHAEEQITGDLDSADRINKISNVWPETLWIGFDTSTTLETAQQVLNNSVLYYSLASTQYITITNEELIEQLESLYTAKSQEGTTNISITSEYLPMLLSASALKKEN